VPWLRCLRQRTLVLAGDDDPIVPVVNGRIPAHLIPDARIARIALTSGRGLRAVGSGPDLGRWWGEGGLEHFDEEVRDHRCNDDQRRDRGKLHLLDPS
jgi:hypothetical protein